MTHVVSSHNRLCLLGITVLGMFEEETNYYDRMVLDIHFLFMHNFRPHNQLQAGIYCIQVLDEKWHYIYYGRFLIANFTKTFLIQDLDTTYLPPQSLVLLVPL